MARPVAVGETGPARRSVILWTTLVIALVAIGGVAFRLEDPLSDRVIPAEDPYTHMALVREHLADGEIEPLYEAGSLYPPGMHVYLGTVWTYTGIELYEIVLIGPAVLGGIGIIGVGLLASRLGGPTAGALAAMAWAVAPESIFRTSMMSPTALDLAILPFLLLSIVEVMRGRLGWLGAATPILLFLIWAHPWALLLLGGIGVVLAVLILALPWQDADGHAKVSAKGFAIVVALFGIVLAVTTHTRSGFGNVLRDPIGIPTEWIVALMVVVALIPLALLFVAPRVLRRALDTPRRRHHIAWRFAASIVLVAALVTVTRLAAAGGFPNHVDLPRMFGWPILALGIAGLVLVPFARGPLSYLGAAIVMATYPLVVFNPLHSPFWPHRTAVFFGIGLVLLVGVATAAAVRAVAALGQRFLVRKTAAAPHGRPSWRVPAVTLTTAALLSLTVVGASPAGYPDGWYRLYEPCEMDAFEEIADTYDADPQAVVITGSWQSKLVIGALAEDTSRVWFKPGMFRTGHVEEADMVHWQKMGTQVIVVVDPHLRDESSREATAFLDSEPWHRGPEYCNGLGGVPQPRIETYFLQEDER